jgi:O-antigen biosynthesis alpha-1,3-rhamnosyltransferase
VALKLALDAIALTGPLTGIGQYVFHLAAGLLQRDDVDARMFYGGEFSRTLRHGAPAHVGTQRAMVRNWVPKAYEISRWLRQRRFDRGLHDQGGAFDVFHEPNYLPFRFDGPTVITVHDLSWIRYPQTHPAERVRIMDRLFEPALRRAALLITDSGFVRQEVIDTFGIAPDNIVSVPLGLDPLFQPMGAAQTAPVLTPLQLEHGNYFLSVGTLEPRKNMTATLQAYARLPAALRSRHPLVIAGMKGWRTTALEQQLEPLIAAGQVRILGYLGRAELAAVTAGALAMVYPSIYEGFGLPPLEAMGCGVVPITSTVSSLPEVVGDTGLQVEPHDIDALAEAMARIAQDPQLRTSLSAAALTRARTFTWSRCVDETVEVYRRAASSR